ncbi:MAG: hypothetical protein ACP5OA_02325 [Candidatus Woesearchaeota archaeon]
MDVKKTEFLQALRDFLLVEKRDIAVKGYPNSKYAKTLISASELISQLQSDLAETDEMGRLILRSDVSISKGLGGFKIASNWKK